MFEYIPGDAENDGKREEGGREKKTGYRYQDKHPGSRIEGKHNPGEYPEGDKGEERRDDAEDQRNAGKGG